MILITHDLGVVADVADRIEVMYAGRIVEEADVEDIYARPAHPYTEGLLKSIPRYQKGQALATIPGTPPNLARIPSGCAFHPRCHRAQAICATEAPDPQVALGRRSRCHFWPEVLDAQR